jgi:uncharacterized protein DUF3592
MKRLLILLAMLIGGPVLIVLGIGEYKNSKQLQADGKVVTAQVVDAKETVGRKGRHKYWLTIQFQPEQGDAQTATSRVSSDRFAQAVNAKSVPIVYLPANPQVFQFGEKAETEYGSVIVGSILTIGALGFIGFLWVAHRSSKRSSNTLSGGPIGIPASPAPGANDEQKAA